MLRNLGIRWQILSALALPVLILGLISGRITYQALLDLRQANQSSQLAQAGSRFGVLINGLSAERALSQDVLTQDRSTQTPGDRAQLQVVRAGVDQGLRSIRSQIYTAHYRDADVQRLLDRVAAVHATIPALREEVDAGKAGPKMIADRYSQVIAADVDLPGDLAETISDPGQAANFRAAGLLDTALEALAQEQITGAAAIKAGRLSISDQRELGTDQDSAQRALTQFRRTAETDQSSALATAFAAPVARADDLAKARTALQQAGTEARPAVRADEWSEATKGQIQAVRGVFNLLSSDGVEQATADYSAARQKLQLTLAGAVGVTVLTLLLALGFSRRISAPLRRLTLAATAISNELPELVENLESDRLHQFDLRLPAVSKVGSNEVSRLTAAFADVNAVTVQVAHKQARLRAAVGDMFVNVARRNQVLLARQLAFIDQLERNEADPDSLRELFRLDHLATRMRRNAESLLVLAGRESGRRLREPMQLSDVVRTATSQIEHYPRVTLSLDVDPRVNAHLALPVAHLLAELLENATNFSDPFSRVVLAAGVTPEGLRIIVTDQGLGMSAAELDDVRLRIEQPPTAETLSSQRLGFFVVGQLAQRLDAQVSLTSERARGTAVALDLPASVFVWGATANLAPVPMPLPVPGPMPIPASLEMAALAEVALEEPTWAPQPDVPDAASLVPLARRVVPAIDPATGLPQDDEAPHGYLGHRGHQLHHDHEHHFHALGPAPAPLAPGEELRMRTLLGAVDVLPLPRTSIRTAMRKGRRATDVALGRTPSDGYDPLGAAREYALREGFIDPAMTEHDAQSDSAAGALAELGGPSAYQPQTIADVAPGELRRRSPNPVLPAQAQPPQEGATRPRSATGVRSMLSGFRSGAERGRTSPSANPAAEEPESDDQQPPGTGGRPRR